MQFEQEMLSKTRKCCCQAVSPENNLKSKAFTLMQRTSEVSYLIETRLSNRTTTDICFPLQCKRRTPACHSDARTAFIENSLRVHMIVDEIGIARP